jgi:hypothetical protein
MSTGGDAPESQPDKPSEEGKGAIDPGWAPNAPTDGRLPYQWQSRWPDAARRQMRLEAVAIVLTVLLGLAAVVVAVFAIDVTSPTFSFAGFLLAALGAGMLGGTTFAIKWFYHVVARGMWHLDRRYWRLFVPYASSLLAVVTSLAVLGSDVAVGKDPRLPLVVKTLLVAFLAGYFSDAASAKLADVAKVVFGVTERHKLAPHEGDSNGVKSKPGS